MQENIIIQNGKRYKKVLICRDSAGQFSSATGIRLITQSFLSARCRGGLYFLGVKTTPLPDPTTPATPSIAPFLVDMSFGQSSLEIARLQGFLTKLGYFTQQQMPTGFYGTITQQAVFAFQKHYVANQSWWAYVVVMGGQGKYCSTMTRTALNQLLT